MLEEVTTMMLVDCETCPVRGRHCADCMVSALARIPMPVLRPVGDSGSHPQAHPDAHPEAHPDAGVPLDAAEMRAVSVLVAAGLVDREEAGRATARRELTGERARRAAV